MYCFYFKRVMYSCIAVKLWLSFNLWLTWMSAIFIEQIKKLWLWVSLQFKIYCVIYIWVVLVSLLCAQFCAQLVHVTSCGWWRDNGRSPLYQSQLATWASCAQSSGTRIFLYIYIYIYIFFFWANKLNETWKWMSYIAQVC